MKRNSMLQIRIETENIEKLRKMSVAEGLTLSEFCRKKLLESSKLEKIEYILEQILRQNEITESD